MTARLRNTTAPTTPAIARATAAQVDGSRLTLVAVTVIVVVAHIFRFLNWRFLLAFAAGYVVCYVLHGYWRVDDVSDEKAKVRGAEAPTLPPDHGA